MQDLPTFLAYAGEFEKTFVDDDWSRLRRFFADDAVYEVKAQSFGCRLEGPEAIFRGIKKSLDGFDRRFESRNIAVVDGPSEVDGELRLGWEVTYHKDGLPPYVLRGRSAARMRDGKIEYLCDSYEPEVEAAAEAWQRANRLSFDPSYV